MKQHKHTSQDNRYEESDPVLQRNMRVVLSLVADHQKYLVCLESCVI